MALKMDKEAKVAATVLVLLYAVGFVIIWGRFPHQELRQVEMEVQSTAERMSIHHAGEDTQAGMRNAWGRWMPWISSPPSSTAVRDDWGWDHIFEQEVGESAEVVVTPELRRRKARCANATMAHWGDRPQASPLWPLYRVTDAQSFDGLTSYTAPGVSWKMRSKRYPGYARVNRSYDWGRRVGLQDDEFQALRFYMYDDAVLNTSAMFECLSAKHKMPSFSKHPDSWLDNVDSKISIVAREYFPELTLLHALLNHPLRTLDPDEASLFVIPYSHSLIEFSHPCKLAISDLLPDYRISLQNLLARRIAASKYFQRHLGRDHMYILTRWDAKVEPNLRGLLDSGPTVLSVERYLEGLNGITPNTFADDRVVIIPYVSSTFLDADIEAPHRFARFSVSPHGAAVDVENKNISRWWFFRGNMLRTGITGHARSSLPNLAEHLGQGRSDFRSQTIPKRSAARHTREELLVQTAEEMRDATVCLCPAGDSPTSLRLFESLAAGCVPVVSADKMHMRHVLPFPNLIDWDEIAFFTEALNDVQLCRSGLLEMADTLNRTMGRDAEIEQLDRLWRMQARGVEVFRRFFSYFRNPRGVADGALFETYRLMKERGFLFQPRTA